jgi:hypothetical protein
MCSKDGGSGKKDGRRQGCDRGIYAAENEGGI